MNKRFAIFLFCLVSLQLYGQNGYLIKGKITDQDGHPLAYSSVYIDGSQTRTMADKEGDFSLQVNRPGDYELVASMVGYTTNSVHFNTGTSPLRISVKLFQKLSRLKDITVGQSDRDWNNYFGIFKKFFLGLSKNAQGCVILNPHEIHFAYKFGTKELTAWADDFIDIENKSLGYTIKYSLEYFNVNLQSGYISFYGKSYFENLDKANEKIFWTANRKLAYMGSERHFFRALYDNTLSKERFVVYKAEKLNISNPVSRKTINERIDFYSRILSNELCVRLRPPPAESGRAFADSLLQYTLLKKYGYGTSFYYHDSIAVDLNKYLFQIDSVKKFLNYPHVFWVVYSGLKEEAAYKQLGSYDWEDRSQNNGDQQTIISVLDPSSTFIYSNGMVLPKTFFYQGYFAWKAMGDELPEDY